MTRFDDEITVADYQLIPEVWLAQSSILHPMNGTDKAFEHPVQIGQQGELNVKIAQHFFTICEREDNSDLFDVAILDPKYGNRQAVFSRGGGIVIGRNPEGYRRDEPGVILNDAIKLDGDEQISSTHALITADDNGGLQVQCLDSKNPNTSVAIQPYGSCLNFGAERAESIPDQIFEEISGTLYRLSAAATQFEPISLSEYQRQAYEQISDYFERSQELLNTGDHKSMLSKSDMLKTFNALRVLWKIETPIQQFYLRVNRQLKLFENPNLIEEEDFEKLQELKVAISNAKALFDWSKTNKLKREYYLFADPIFRGLSYSYNEYRKGSSADTMQKLMEKYRELADESLLY
jgi:hypothetical protein